MLIRYREAMVFRSVWTLLAAGVIGIPIGVFYFVRVEEELALFVLGVVILMYALYALIGFRLPKLSHPAWVWVFGITGGVLGGAYNTSGPPVILFGNCREWQPDEFKSNLAGFFLVGSIMAAFTHWANGNITLTVSSLFLQSLPALLLGFIMGQFLDRWLKPEVFRKIVLILLIALGIRLML